MKLISVIASIVCVTHIILNKLVNRLSITEDLVEKSCENDPNINDHDNVQ